ncbi:MAG TPA: flippase-like domain-containing protein [Candidatus Moranbacteria bacterium]|nr:flippase-like domain-containing protein [Candidatus Moranbacteria bacterium]
MRILILNYEYPPLGGGAGNATFYMLKEFSKIPDFYVSLVTSSADKEYHLEKIGENIEIHKLPIGKNNNDMHFQTNKDLLVYSWKAYWFSKKLAREKEFDVALAFFGIPCGCIAKKLGLPYIVSLRGSDVPFYNERFHFLDKLFFKFMSRGIWKEAQKVVALSKDLAFLAKKTSPNQEITVVRNGINTSEFYPSEEALKNEKTFNILFVGRLIERKGAIYMLEAFKSLSKKYENIRLLIAGEGPLLEKYKKFARDNNLSEKIIFLGIVNHNEIAKIYQKSHVFILPSLNEALGNVTQEALASGLPIITTDTGAAELIDENGFIIRKKSSQDISDCLEKVINNENLRQEMSKKSREAAEKMSWSEVARRYVEILKKASVKKEKPGKNNKLKLIFKLIATAIFLVWIFFKIDWPEVLVYFEKLDIWWMFAFVVIYAGGTLISSYKWKLLADFKGINLKFWEIFKIYLTGAFINNFFPSIIGGDTYRSYTLGKAGNKKYLEATSTVFADRLIGFAGVMLLIIVFSLLDLSAVFENHVLLVANLAIIAFFAINFFLVAIRKIPIWDFVKKFIPEKIIGLIREIRFYQQHKILIKTLFLGAAFNFFGVGLASWMLFLDLHIPISFIDFMIAISIVSIVSSVPVSIGNIGIKEWAFITFFGIFGVNGEAAISIAIFGRFLQMIVSFFAIPFYLKEKNKKI